MPNLDGTGPQGNGPRTGRGFGRGAQRRSNGTKKCSCPKCGYVMDTQRGTPCTEIKCPKCNSTMKGEQCK